MAQNYSSQNHYQTLEVTPTATQAEIKQAYRRLAKLFHPDSNRPTANHERITSINAAYEVLGDPKRRQYYDRELGNYVAHGNDRTTRETEAQRSHRRRSSGQATDDAIQLWIRYVYQPVNRKLGQVLSPLKTQINRLAADPFDDELMEQFQTYLDECRDRLTEAQRIFQSMPNPANAAGAAANLYYALSQLIDGIDELERFTVSYAENYLHTGQELFRIAARLRSEAQDAIHTIAR